MNRECAFPGGIYPLVGDVQSTAGNQTVTVTGLQNVSIATPFVGGGEVLEYDVNSHTWIPTLRAAIQVNNITVSDDGLMSVNVPKQALVNGS